MLGRIRSWVSKAKAKIKAAGTAIATTIVMLAETNTTTTQTFDYSSLTNIVVAVIPLFVLIAVIKMLFKSFKDVA